MHRNGENNETFIIELCFVFLYKNLSVIYLVFGVWRCNAWVGLLSATGPGSSNFEKIVTILWVIQVGGGRMIPNRGTCITNVSEVIPLSSWKIRTRVTGPTIGESVPCDTGPNASLGSLGSRWFFLNWSNSFLNPVNGIFQHVHVIATTINHYSSQFLEHKVSQNTEFAEPISTSSAPNGWSHGIIQPLSLSSRSVVKWALPKKERTTLNLIHNISSVKRVC